MGGVMKDRNPKYATSTVLCILVLGFALGFLACHKIYAGIDKDKWEKEIKRDFYYEEIEPLTDK